ncbi:MAG: response regulator [Defluviitaleaceae bacterium]|nr:response regulator [Defluviitaleaceae bacterium]
MTVMVVDDVSLMRKILTNILVQHCKLEKSNVHEASDGTVAVADFKRVNPKVIFLDVVMPKMGGQEAVRELLKQGPDVHIVMCSAAGEREIVKECVRAGAKDYIIKPVDPERVKVALQKAGFNDKNYDDDDEPEIEHTFITLKKEEGSGGGFDEKF